MSRTGRNLTLMFDVIRSLMQAPRTLTQLIELHGMHDHTLRYQLPQMIAAGLVHRTGRGVAYDPHVYHWCPVPFEVPASAREDGAA